MNDDANGREDIEQAQPESLTCEVSDEALEAAAGASGHPNVTEKFTAFGVTNCLLC
jgi:hypothetical protein